MPNQTDPWSGGQSYEQFMGRWSTLIARKFLAWLAVPAGSSWLDVGCGTGALTRLILETGQPKQVLAIDSSSEFIAYARQSISHPAARFQVGQAQSLELETNAMDAVVSGLALNFVPQPGSAIAEMIRVARPGGRVGIFVWDYAEGMEMLRYFWDAAVELDRSAEEFDEGLRFPICQEGRLEALAIESGLKQVEAVPIEVRTVFQDFDEYWLPFLGNVGPAPAYNMSLSEDHRRQLEYLLHATLPIDQDGSFSLMARAWAVKGTA